MLTQTSCVNGFLREQQLGVEAPLRSPAASKLSRPHVPSPTIWAGWSITNHCQVFDHGRDQRCLCDPQLRFLWRLTYMATVMSFFTAASVRSRTPTRRPSNSKDPYFLLTYRRVFNSPIQVRSSRPQRSVSQEPHPSTVTGCL